MVVILEEVTLADSGSEPDKKQPMRKVFTGTIFKDLTNILKQIQVASPH